MWQYVVYPDRGELRTRCIRSNLTTSEETALYQFMVDNGLQKLSVSTFVRRCILDKIRFLDNLGVENVGNADLPR